VHVWIARVALVLAVALPSRAAIGQARATTPPPDTSLARRTQVVTDTVLRTLAPEIARARRRREASPYVLKLPTDTTIVHWARVRRTLVDSLRARAATEADTLVDILTIDVQRSTPVALSLRMFSGAKWLCHGEWRGGGRGVDVFVPWDTTTPPPMGRGYSNSHSLPCSVR
jgi:hypothetical protein